MIRLLCVRLERSVGRVEDVVMFGNHQRDPVTPECKGIGAVRMNHIRALRRLRKTQQIRHQLHPERKPGYGRPHPAADQCGSNSAGEYVGAAACTNRGKPHRQFALAGHPSRARQRKYTWYCHPIGHNANAHAWTARISHAQTGPRQIQ